MRRESCSVCSGRVAIAVFWLRVEISVSCQVALLYQLRDQRCPALVAGSQALSVLAVEVFKVGQTVTPVRIVLQLLSFPVEWPPALIISEKEPSQSALKLQTNLPQVQTLAGAGWAFDQKFIPEKVMEFLERLDQEEVDREPNGASPVRVAAEEPALRLSRLIVDSILIPIEPQRVGMIAMVAGERPDAIRRQKFRLVQHEAQHRSQTVPVDQRQESPDAGSRCERLNIISKLWQIVDEILHPPFEARQRVDQLRVQRLHGEQWDQSHQGTHPHGLEPPVWHTQHVIVEAVSPVP